MPKIILVFFCKRKTIFDTLTLLPNKNIKIILNYVLGPLVFLLLFYSIYHQILKQPDWKQSLLHVGKAITRQGRWGLLFTLCLMVVNWGLETKKWQLAIAQLQPLPFPAAFRAVLTGVTIGSFTPNRMGEYLGRMVYVDEGKRIASISLTVVCSMAQMLVTLVTGCAGLLCLSVYLHRHTVPDQDVLQAVLIYFFSGTIIVLLIITFFFFRLSHLVRILQGKVSSKYLNIVKVLDELDTGTRLRILGLSFARYLVFLLQYDLMYRVFGVDLSWGEVFTAVSVMFLVIAVVPSLTFLTDLGLRWTTSIRVVQIFSPNNAGIFAVSLGIWLINLIIPALIGSLLILRNKLFTKK